MKMRFMIYRERLSFQFQKMDWITCLLSLELSLWRILDSRVWKKMLCIFMIICCFIFYIKFIFYNSSLLTDTFIFKFDVDFERTKLKAFLLLSKVDMRREKKVFYKIYWDWFDFRPRISTIKVICVFVAHIWFSFQLFVHFVYLYYFIYFLCRNSEIITIKAIIWLERVGYWCIMMERLFCVP